MKTMMIEHGGAGNVPSSWLRRAGVAGFAFFFIKGMIWLLVAAAAWLGFTG